MGRREELIGLINAIIPNLGSGVRVAILEFTNVEGGKIMPLPFKEAHGAEPIAVQPEDEEAGFSIFQRRDNETRYSMPILLYDEELFNREFLEPIKEDPDFQNFTDWHLDVSTFGYRN